MGDDAPSTVTAPYMGSWHQRRRVIYGTLVFCGVNVGYLTAWGSDTALHQQIAIALIGLAASVIASFVFGAVWDDHSIRKAQQGGQ